MKNKKIKPSKQTQTKSLEKEQLRIRSVMFGKCEMFKRRSDPGV